jgi:hypothetical protein
MTKFRVASEKDLDYLSEICESGSEKEALERVETARKKGVNFNALEDGTKYAGSALASELMMMPPWPAVYKKLVEAGFDPLAAPDNSFHTPFAVQILENFAPTIYEGDQDFPQSGLLYAESPINFLTFGKKCSVMEAAKYLLSFGPDLTEQVAFYTTDDLEETFDETAEAFLLQHRFFPAAIAEALRRMVHYAAKGGDYRKVFAYNEAFGRPLKGAFLCKDPQGADKIIPSGEVRSGGLAEASGQLVFSFEGAALLFTENWVPVVDNNAAESQTLSCSGLFRDFIGKKLSDIVLWMEKDPQNPGAELRMRGKLLFEDQTAIDLKPVSCD